MHARRLIVVAALLAVALLVSLLGAAPAGAVARTSASCIGQFFSSHAGSAPRTPARRWARSPPRRHGSSAASSAHHQRGPRDEVAELGRTLVEHWDGSAWTVVPSPNLGPGNNRLTAVAAVAANDVWAVGVAGLGTLVVHWDGATWSVVASPNPSSSADLAGVAAVSATDVWAVGGYFDETTGVLRTLVEHWDGSAWSVVASPNVPPSDNRLNAVATLAARQWAVGSYFSELGPVQTLIVQRCG